jgi:hypothetical protein
MSPGFFKFGDDGNTFRNTTTSYVMEIPKAYSSMERN